MGTIEYTFILQQDDCIKMESNCVILPLNIVICFENDYVIR